MTFTHRLKEALHLPTYCLAAAHYYGPTYADWLAWRQRSRLSSIVLTLRLGARLYRLLRRSNAVEQNSFLVMVSNVMPPIIRSP
jgi:hypothetical protein